MKLTKKDQKVILGLLERIQVEADNEGPSVERIKRLGVIIGHSVDPYSGMNKEARRTHNNYVEARKAEVAVLSKLAAIASSIS